MIRRRESLASTLGELEGGTLTGVSVVVVSRAWWDELAHGEQTDYRKRCASMAIVLRTDERLSRHFVELGDHPIDPPLSTEREL